MPRGGGAFRSEVLTTPPAALYAAARNYTVGKSDKVATVGGKEISGEAWQSRAWDFYDTVGEYRYSVDWVGNLLSKAKLYPTRNGKKTADPLALEAMMGLFGGPDGQAEMLRQLGIQFTVTGEAYIIGEDAEDADSWGVYAATEVKNDGRGTFTVCGEKVEGNDALVIRLWKAHPRKPKKSSCPTMAILPILAEIDKLTQHVAAQIDSRLAGAGILILPSEMSFPVMPSTSPRKGEPEDKGEEVVNAAGGAQGFVNMLMEVMSTAIANRADASAITPILLQVAGEYIDKVQHLTFWSELDEHAIALRTEAIRRLALGMDMPPEVLTGVADVNHWGAWQIDESAIKAHSEPLLAVIASALTTGYLRPYLLDEMDEEEVAEFGIGVDTTQLRMRPNRSREAIELWDRGVLTVDVLLAENGFDPLKDKMRPGERRGWLTQKVAQGQTMPEYVAEALRILGVDIDPLTEEAGAVPINGEDGAELPPIRSLEKHPDRNVPEEKDSEAEGRPRPLPRAADAASLLATSEVMVFRALERAGNRIKTRIGAAQVPVGVAAADLYLHMPDLPSGDVNRLLEDAWSCSDRFALDCDLDALSDILDSYTRTLLALRAPYDRQVLATRLQELSLAAVS